ncbi:serine hydrolase [Bifidobacterium cuniculi]|uniref:Beta-lactamase class A catalytic domain-containing protein n=1 Tax=Bifidobacterium cuniculi TaxID=1688 RepID=A0A087ATD6_9BIFI|nr:serine hydrolase [Bifidobacterium cuniculi]KFI62036.1 hypothetical protein BCUN_1351 [Bifidobacterium cuniculi]
MSDRQLDAAIAAQERAIRHWKTVLMAVVMVLVVSALVVGGAILFPHYAASQIVAEPASGQEQDPTMLHSAATASASPTPSPSPTQLTLNGVTELALENLDAVDGNSEFATLGLELSDEANAQIEAAVQAITDQGYGVSFVMVDLSTGGVLSAEGNVERYSASSIKAPYIVSLAQTGTIDLGTVASGNNLMLANLIANTLHVSDNDAYDTLYTTYGRMPFLQWAADSGIADTQIGYYGDLTALDLARMWTMTADYLFAAKPMRGATADASARGWLADQMIDSLNSVISEAEPERLVYSKGGWIYGEGGFYALNDGGIVLSGDDALERLDGRPSGVVVTVLSDACGRNDLLVPLVEALVAAVDA